MQLLYGDIYINELREAIFAIKIIQKRQTKPISSTCRFIIAAEKQFSLHFLAITMNT